MIEVREEPSAALSRGRPVVALESSLIAHGLPWPHNLEAAREAEAAVRAEGAIPATIAIVAGAAVVGLSSAEIEHLARGKEVRKASTRDLGPAVARGEWAATTVAASIRIAHLAGISIFATGGIGGVHPGTPPDVSADLPELARTPVTVVCAGAKSILDLRATLEMLETLGVPVIGYGTSELPAFYSVTSGLPLPCRIESPEEAARIIRAHRATGGAGLVIAQPLPEGVALPADEVARAAAEADSAGMTGPARTPYILGRLATVTGGRSLTANRALVLANARLAARIALAVREEAL
jgi:pseudouridine-5'-phosphate glycosidase